MSHWLATRGGARLPDLSGAGGLGGCPSSSYARFPLWEFENWVGDPQPSPLFAPSAIRLRVGTQLIAVHIAKGGNLGGCLGAPGTPPPGFARFVRMVVVVAFVEEIFWRGFLMRYLLDKDGDYWEQPFGKFSWLSFLVVTLLFMFAHSPSDYLGALVYGSLAYALAVKTKSLAACIFLPALILQPLRFSGHWMSSAAFISSAQASSSSSAADSPDV